jgi:hypothetical protein
MNAWNVRRNANPQRQRRWSVEEEITMGVRVRQCPDCNLLSPADAERCVHCGELLSQAPLVDADAVSPEFRNAGLAGAAASERLDAATVICPNCGFEGAPIALRPGSTGLEVLLWIAGLIPGLVYSVWRATIERPVVCQRCTYPYVVPVGTREAERLRARFARPALPEG